MMAWRHSALSLSPRISSAARQSFRRVKSRKGATQISRAKSCEAGNHRPPCAAAALLAATSTCTFATISALAAAPAPKTLAEAGTDETAGEGIALEPTKADSEERDADDGVDESCPFCRFFLDSPCREEFLRWHGCVQTSDEATDCMAPFHPLKECMDDHGIAVEGEEGGGG